MAPGSRSPPALVASAFWSSQGSCARRRCWWRAAARVGERMALLGGVAGGRQRCGACRRLDSFDGCWRLQRVAAVLASGRRLLSALATGGCWSWIGGGAWRGYRQRAATAVCVERALDADVGGRWLIALAGGFTLAVGVVSAGSCWPSQRSAPVLRRGDACRRKVAARVGGGIKLAAICSVGTAAGVWSGRPLFGKCVARAGGCGDRRLPAWDWG